MRMFRLARLTARERYVIGLLRGADPAVAGGALVALFCQLRRAWSAIGFRPGLIGSVYATRQELCLLGVIAVLQRDNPNVTLRISQTVRLTARACAHRLAEEGIFLTHAAFARLSGIGEMCKELSIWISPIVSHPPRSTRPAYPPLPASLQAKALGFVRERGHTSSRDLAGFGVSRPVVSLMFKRGLLLRVRTGVYQAAPETMRG